MPPHRLAPTEIAAQVLGSEPRLVPPRVVVAEDDPDMRQLLVEALRKDRYQVIEADSGSTLLTLLASQLADHDEPDSVDLVISDVRMPGCSGSQVLDQLRAAHRRIPVILMTAFGDPAVGEHAQRMGAILFRKPFDISDLRVAVAYVLGSSDGARRGQGHS
jgi:DNA-binding response OmpR family regulator